MPPIVMSGAFDALRIVWFRNENFSFGPQLVSSVFRSAFFGAPVFLDHVVYMFPVLYRVAVLCYVVLACSGCLLVRVFSGFASLRGVTP